MIDLATARRATDAALSRAAELGLSVSVVVCDDRAHEVFGCRGDGASWQTVEIARAQAQTAASFGRDSAALGTMREKWPDVFDIANDALPFRATSLAGGLVVIRDGRTLAAIGVSGALPDQDVEIAEAARALF
jgi:glc operon protein GlcG